jgi:N-sulfoglucosamine sulfohydrolase
LTIHAEGADGDSRMARRDRSLVTTTPEDRHTRPHILFITCHDLGRHLGCYGVPSVQSPQIDALAAGGVRFARAFTTAPTCSQSRSALATGRYPHSNGVMGLAHPPFGWTLTPDEQHIAQLLGSAGYSTHLFGHQHLTDRVARLGFDNLHGFDEVLGCHEPALGASVSARFIAFLDGLRPDAPLYMEINLEEPHRPYDQGGAVPDEELGVYVPNYLPPGDASHYEMAMLQGAIRQADRGVGRILVALEEAGIASNTLVVFSADHGLAMPRAKCTLYDPGLETALLMRWPSGGLVRGDVRPEMVSNVDVLPTLLEAAGVPAPATLQGRSLLPLLRGESYTLRTEIYAEKTYHSYYDPMRAVRTERYKYIRNYETTFVVEVPADVQVGAIFRAHTELYAGAEHPPVELYDLQTDAWERHNLAGMPGLREIEERLDVQLQTWMDETDDPLLRGPVPSPSWSKAMRARKVPRSEVAAHI